MRRSFSFKRTIAAETSPDDPIRRVDMSPKQTPELLPIFLLLFLLLQRSSDALETIKAEPGQEVTLPCKVPNNDKPITAVEWSRDELDQEQYVLFYRDGHLDPDNQLPSYQNRTDLQDKEMKNGDVSLKLMNVTKDDTGTYECRVSQRRTNRRKRSTLDSDPINTIYLDVGPPGHKDGGDKDGGGKAGGHKDGGGEDGGNKDGGGISEIMGEVSPPLVTALACTAVIAHVCVVIYKEKQGVY